MSVRQGVRLLVAFAVILSVLATMPAALADDDDDETIKIIKVCDPANDGGKFDLYVARSGDSPMRLKNDAKCGDSATSGDLRRDTTYKVYETGNTGTDLDDYTTKIECVDKEGDTASATGTEVNVYVEKEDQWTCTITNTRKPPPTPAIDIEKYTQWQDADAPRGPAIRVGSTVYWDYRVTNTGNTHLYKILVQDSDPSVNVVCPKNDLAPKEFMTCQATGVAVAGQYRNLGYVRGWFQDRGVTDKDLSHYFGVFSGIDVEKSTNGVDADFAPGPNIPVGDPVTWKYVVTNTGNIRLFNVGVNDTVLGGITCPYSDLFPGESMTCTATGVATAGQYENVAIAQGTEPCRLIDEDDEEAIKGLDRDCPIVFDRDWSHYFGREAGDGPFFDLGLIMQGPWQVKGNWGTEYVDVQYTYRLTNAGPDAAKPAILDDVCSPVTYWYGDTDKDGLIDPGETWFLRCTYRLDSNSGISSLVSHAVALGLGYETAPWNNTASWSVNVAWFSFGWGGYGGGWF